MLDTVLEPVTSVVGGRLLNDWATEAPNLMLPMCWLHMIMLYEEKISWFSNTANVSTKTVGSSVIWTRTFRNTGPPLYKLCYNSNNNNNNSKYLYSADSL